MTMTAKVQASTAPRTVIKLVQPPREPRPAKPVDFDLTDADEWGRYAITSNAWSPVCEVGPQINHVSFDVEIAVAIAAPDGRVAVWYGMATTVAPVRRRGFRQRDVTKYNGAATITKCRAAAAWWDEKRTRGGDRDVRPLALAACRVLHAQVFGDPPSPRDQLLAEFATLEGADRPDTTHILRASDDALLAASALLALKNYEGACALLAGKGVTG